MVWRVRSLFLGESRTNVLAPTPCSAKHSAMSPEMTALICTSSPSATGTSSQPRNPSRTNEKQQSPSSPERRKPLRHVTVRSLQECPTQPETRLGAILTTLLVTEVWFLTGNSRRKVFGGSQFERTQSVTKQKARQPC